MPSCIQSVKKMKCLQSSDTTRENDALTSSYLDSTPDSRRMGRCLLYASSPMPVPKWKQFVTNNLLKFWFSATDMVTYVNGSKQQMSANDEMQTQTTTNTQTRKSQHW